jgi:AcrR family transcriptional regulator
VGDGSDHLDTRRRILDAALTSFVDDGFERTTIARIRERSGASNGALFHHFPSKEAIADALYVEAIASFQTGLWDLVRARPRSLRAAVRGTIAHQLTWVEHNRRLATFVYARDHLDPDSSGGASVSALNRELASAWREWMTPLLERGELSVTSMVVISSIVGGPAHAIARRWLAGHLDQPPSAFMDELTDAACAGLQNKPVRGRPSRNDKPTTGHVTVAVLAADGSVIAHGEATTELRSDADGVRDDQVGAGRSGGPANAQPSRDAQRLDAGVRR